MFSGTVGENPIFIFSNIYWLFIGKELEILISGSIIKLFKRLFSSSGSLEVDRC
jgi:hypothetical protein